MWTRKCHTRPSLSPPLPSPRTASSSRPRTATSSHCLIVTLPPLLTASTLHCFPWHACAGVASTRTLTTRRRTVSLRRTKTTQGCLLKILGSTLRLTSECARACAYACACAWCVPPLTQYSIRSKVVFLNSFRVVNTFLSCDTLDVSTANWNAHWTSTRTTKTHDHFNHTFFVNTTADTFRRWRKRPSVALLLS
jgi:hypothetical protein